MRPTLYEFAGGEAAFVALATAHHARCLADPELNHPFSHDDQHPQHVQRLAAYWAEVLGGPPAYSDGCGDHSGVLQMHAGNGGGMTDLGERFVRCFDAAADDEIVRRIAAGGDAHDVRVVTSDGWLADQVRAAGASVQPALAFRNELDPV